MIVKKKFTVVGRQVKACSHSQVSYNIDNNKIVKYKYKTHIIRQRHSKKNIVTRQLQVNEYTPFQQQLIYNVSTFNV